MDIIIGLLVFIFLASIVAIIHLHEIAQRNEDSALVRLRLRLDDNNGHEGL